METRTIHKDQQGFTLMETCIALMLIMIISSTGSQIYTIDTILTDTSTSLKNVKIVVTPQGRSTTGGVYSGTDGWMYG